MKKLTQIILFLVCASSHAQRFSGVADISSTTDNGGGSYTVYTQSFNGGYLFGGQTAYTALSIQAGDVLWFQCDTFRVQSVGSGSADGVAVTVNVTASQSAPTAASRVAFLRETDDQTEPLPYTSIGFGLSPDVWQCIQAYYAEHYRKVVRKVDPYENPTKTAEVNVSVADSIPIVVRADVRTNRLTVFADSVQIKGEQENRWARILNTKTNTKFEYQFADGEVHSFGMGYDGIDAGEVPAKYRYNLAGLFDGNSLISKAYADSLHAAGGGGGSGTVTSVGVSGGATGLSTSGSPVTTSGTITLAGTLDVDNGGTGATTASGARTNLGLGTLATQSGTFSGTSSGTNTGDQTITLTGDVTGSGAGSFTATIADGAVGSSELAQQGATTGQVLKWNGAAWVPGMDDNSGGGGSLTVAEEGSTLTSSATSLNFVGTNLTATNSGGDVTVTASPVKIEFFGNVGTADSTYTWTKPAGAVEVFVFVVGPGAGGGSGAKQASGTAASGGGGGGGGNAAETKIPAEKLGSTVTVTVPCGRAGGAAVSGNGNGVAGSSATGSYTSFGAHTRANGGANGGAGTTTTGSPGGASTWFWSGTQGATGNSTTNGGSGAAISVPAGSGGGGGGGVNTTPTASAGGNGGTLNLQSQTGGGGGASTGANGASGPNAFGFGMQGGAGGGGGGGSTSGNGGGGGTGGQPGGGGGGGGGTVSGNSGAGGRGGGGGVWVVTRF